MHRLVFVAYSSQCWDETVRLHTMWNASAINASDPTVTPTPNSRMKKHVSITSMMIMRVDFDIPILAAVESLSSDSSEILFLDEVPVQAMM